MLAICQCYESGVLESVNVISICLPEEAFV